MRLARIVLTALVIAGLGGVAWAGGMDVRIKPNLVKVGLFFGGAKVELSGQVPEGAQVAVLLQGPAEDDVFKVKTRTLGVFWLNQGKVVFHHVPSVYCLYTTPGIEPQCLEEIGLGFKALEARVGIDSQAHRDKDFLFNEFVKLKSSHRLYGLYSGAVELKGRQVHAQLEILPRMPRGHYDVKVVVLKQGKVIASKLLAVELKETELLAKLISLVKNHGLIYGILAVLVAVAAGLVMDLVVGTKGGAH